MKNHVQDRTRQSRYVPGRRSFGIDEANRSLVLVRRIVEDIISGHSSLLELQETYEIAQTHGRTEEARRLRTNLIAAADNIRACLDELTLIGVEIKDWALGIVDFPARFNGRHILLCWRWGEPTVGYWHEINEGFSGRKPIEMLEGALEMAKS